MQPIPAFKSCLRQYATFSGRATRSEFWFFVLLKFVASYALNFVGGIVSAIIALNRIGFPPVAHPATAGLPSFYSAMPVLAWMLILVVPSVAVEVRRLHDLDRSGWWWWFNLVPIAGPLWLLYWNCTAGTPGENRFGPDPLPASERGAMMAPIDAVKSCLSKYASFKGRASRAEYWFFMLFSTVMNWVIVSVMMIIGALVWIPAGRFNHGAHPSPAGVLFFILAALIAFGLSVALYLPSLSVGVRRLHDIGRSGWSYWLYCIPLVGFVLMLVWNCERGTPGPNRFGPDPLAPKFGPV